MPGGSPTSLLHVSKENRVDLEPALPSAVIDFQIPSSTITFSRSSRPKRQVWKELPTYQNEEEFSKGSIAKASSIYFAAPDRYPRCFLWRLLEENTVLEVRSVDLSKKHGVDDGSSQILKFHFPTPVRQDGVALADGQEESILNVFVLTTSNELYTLGLKASYFSHATASQEDIGRWCSVFKPASTSFCTPHRFIAINSLELLIGLSDGRILHLSRARGGDGNNWHEVAYNDGQWGSSLRSLVRWQASNTIRYGNTTLDQNTVQTMVVSPDKEHLWIVCLNHTLKARNIKEGKTVFSTDLLGVPREPHEVSKLLLDPKNPNMLRVFQIPTMIGEGDLYYVMTFSPHDLGQFKIWAVRDADSGDRGIRDLYSDATMQPPDPDPNPDSKAIWKVTDFNVTVTESQRNSFVYFNILMRSNRPSKLFTLKLAADDLMNSLVSAWQDDWTVTSSEFVDHETPPKVNDANPDGVVDSWLDFILKPGRYTQATLHTALSIYGSTKKLTISVDPKASLRERTRSTISSNVALKRADVDIMDFDGYRASLGEEFLDLWQEIRDLDALRWEHASFCYDHEVQLPWLVFGDGCSPIRQCSQIEIIAHNTQDVLEGLEGNPNPPLDLPILGQEGDHILPNELATLVAAAASFRQSFSNELLQISNAKLTSELWRSSKLGAPVRIQAFHEDCEFNTEIDQNTWNRLHTQLGPIGGVWDVRNTHFKAAEECLLRPLPREQSDLQSTRFGLKVLVRGTQEMVALSHRILSDLLLLAIAIEGEVDRDEDPMDDFDASQFYMDMLETLKKIHVIQWLAAHVRPEPIIYDDSHEEATFSQKPPIRVSTVLEHLFALDVTPRSHQDQSETENLTENIEDVLTWAVGASEEELEDVLVRIQCNLLAQGSLDLASDFLPYLPSNPWATYIKGRYYLSMSDYTEAALYFEKASSKLCKDTRSSCSIQGLPIVSLHAQANNFKALIPKDEPDEPINPAYFDSLLSEEELEQFYHGPASYFLHIQNLFEDAHCPSYVADFAKKILQQRKLSKHQQNETLKTLFHASIAILDFDDAFTVLKRIPLIDSSTLLPEFLSAILAEDEFDKALDLPWPSNLLSYIEDFLVHKASKTPATASYNSSAPQHDKLLAAWRMRHLDYRGAAAALLTYLQRVQKSKRKSSMDDNDEIISTYLSVINLLTCCGGEDEAWVLSDAFEEAKPKAKHEQHGQTKNKRRLVTIKDVRGRYQKELDHRSMLETGRWSFGLDGAGDEQDGMDVDKDMEDA